MDYETLFKYLNELDFLERLSIGVGFHRWSLKGTDKGAYLYRNSTVIRWEIFNQEPGRRGPFTPIPFEEVFESVPPDIQEKLLFHLDLFKNNKK